MFDHVGRSIAGAGARRAPLAMWAGLLCVAACSDAGTPVQVPPPPPPPPNEVPAPPIPVCSGLSMICSVPLPTYDGSGQLVHPDVAVFPDGFGGHEFWLAATPYPNGNANLENPSLYTDDARHWMVPPGVTNPLIKAPGSPAHNSDPDVVYDPAAKRLRLYYRLTKDNADDIHMRSSADGAHWSTDVSVVRAPGIAIVSPAVVRTPAGQWVMWSVNAVQSGCQARTTVLERRTSPDGIHWSVPRALDAAQPGYVLWHLDVQYIPSKGEYWALIAAYPVGSGCAANDLFFARSADGIAWQMYPTPIVARADYAAYSSTVYRSTFYYDADNDAVRFWLSGAVFRDGSWDWTAATSRWRLADVMAKVTTPLAPRDGVAPIAQQPAVWNGTSPAASQSDFP
ncbi:MAG: hypothetical protein ACREND_09605 [Gemmatimonadaceae bacterium]